jgi:hypothetical protein
VESCDLTVDKCGAGVNAASSSTSFSQGEGAVHHTNPSKKSSTSAIKKLQHNLKPLINFTLQKAKAVL